ncbi:MAG: plasmid partition protein ParG [Rhodothermales bacterium]
MKLTKEERDILESVEQDTWKSVTALKEETERYRVAARDSLRKDKRVNIRMNERDLRRFKKAASREGLPYQTLISSVLHKYINGWLVEAKD